MSTVSAKVDSAFDRLESDLATRSELRRGKARGVWRGLCQRMANGGELTVSELAKLEQAASDLGIRDDDLHERFVSDIEVLQQVKRLAASVSDYEAKSAELDGKLRSAVAEIERIMSEELPRLRGEEANSRCSLNSLCEGHATYRRLIASHPDLFDSPA